jgi:hypothetical protein
VVVDPQTQVLIRNWYIPGGGHLRITPDLKIDHRPPRKKPGRPKGSKNRTTPKPQPVWKQAKKALSLLSGDWFDHTDIQDRLKVERPEALKILRYLHEQQHTVRRWETEGFVYQLVPQS